MAKKTAGRKRGNGDGGLYWIESRKLWRAVVDNGYWPDGRRRQLSVMGKTAEIARAKMKQKLDEIDEFGAPIDAKTTIADWAPHWLETVCKPKLKPNALAKYESLSRTWIVPALGRRTVASIKPSDIRLVHRSIIDAGRSSSTALAAHNVLSGMLDSARLDGLCKRNVADDVAPPKAAVSTRDALPNSDAIKILQAAAKRDDGTRWWVALLGGVRQSERLGARIDSLDLDAGVLHIDWQLDEITSEHGCGEQVAGVWPCKKKRGASCSHRRFKIPDGFEFIPLAGRLCLIKPKSGKTRTVPLLPQLVVELRKHLERSAHHPNPHGLIWRHEDGTPLLPGEDQDSWTSLLLDAKIVTPEQVNAKRIPTTHWARHTTATVLMELGVDAKIIGEIVGHQDTKTTRRYQHVSSAAARDAMAQLGTHFAEALN